MLDRVVIGKGKVAQHFCNYLTLSGLPYTHWYREHSLSVESALIGEGKRVYLLISDDALIPFMQQHIELKKHIVVHFSGSRMVPHAYGAHPLMTFSKHLYPLARYQQIPWALDENSPNFSYLFPGLHNFSFRVSASQKPYYHAWCVMANNFTTLLWQHFFTFLSENFNIPAKASSVFLEQTVYNLMHFPQDALTGPLKREDGQTLDENIKALEQRKDSFLPVYKAFCEAYFSQNSDKGKT